VSGRVSKMGETAAQTRCLWLWPVQLETCSLEHYRAATADLGPEFPTASPSLHDADLSALHRSRVQSLMSSVVGNPPAARLCNPRKLWSWLSSRRLSVELPGRGRVDVFPLRRLLDGVLIPVVNPRFITSYYTGQHVVRGSTVDSQQLRTCFHPNDFWTGVRKHGAHLARTLLKPKCSRKIFKTLPYKAPTYVASFRTFSRQSPVTGFLTAWQHSSVVDMTGRPARVSSSSDVRPRLNSATHLVTVE